MILSFTNMPMDDSKYLVSGKCPRCQEGWQIPVDKNGFDSWRNGALIQKALPELSVNDRELLISGMCARCFDEIFPPED